MTDNGSEYTSAIIKKYLQEENIRHIKIKVRHQTTNGCVERVHQKLQNNLLKEYIKDNNTIKKILIIQF